MKLAYDTYCKLITEDIDVMCESMSDNLERKHIIEVLKDSVFQHYGRQYMNCNESKHSYSSKCKLVLGIGHRNRKINPTAIDRKCYSTWYGMLRRCYSSEYLSRNTSYRKNTVCDDWLYYDKFELWFMDNYVKGYQLDKDIRCQGNTIYSPETCVYIPPQINTVVLGKSKNGNSAASGIEPSGSKYRVVISKYNKDVYLGTFDSLDEATSVYCNAKKDHITEVADRHYKARRISRDIHECLLNWKVT
jgi:hypothetical protein